MSHKRILFLTSEKTGSTLLTSALLGQNGYFTTPGKEGAFKEPNKPVWIHTIPEQQCKFYYDIDYNLTWVRQRKQISNSEAYRTYPSGITHISFWNSFPEPSSWKFIYLFRDPRNRATSKAHRYARARRRVGENYEQAFDLVFKQEVQTAAYEMSSILSAQQDPRFYLLRSENLFSDPLGEFTKAWNFIGFKLDTAFYKKHFETQTKKWKVSTFKDDGEKSNERWTTLSPARKQLFKDRAGQQLIQMQYEKDMNW